MDGPSPLPDLVDRIYEAALVPEHWPDILSRVSAASGSIGTTLFVTDLSRVGRWTASPGIRQHMEDWISGGWQARTQRTSRMVAKAHQGFITDLDVFTAEEWQQEESFLGFFKPRGLGWGAGTFIPMPTGDNAVVSVERSFAAGPMGAAEIAILDGLRPHLARSALIAARLRLEAARSTAQLFEDLGLPAAVVGPRGAVLAMNKAMESLPCLVTRAFGRLGYAGSSRDGSDGDPLAVMAAAPPGARSVPLPEQDGAPAMIIHEVPISRSAHDIFGSGLKLLVGTPLLIEGGPDAFLLAGLFDLTPSEARVAQALASGAGTFAAAEQLGLSRETVRTHLKAILAKTNTRGQAELAALLASARIGRPSGPGGTAR